MAEELVDVVMDLFENLKKLKGIMKTNKSWKELKEEYYEGFVD